MADAKFTCETCKFWLEQNIIGHCRRFPKYHNTSKTHWCGEYSTNAPEVVVKRKYVRKTDAQANEG